MNFVFSGDPPFMSHHCVIVFMLLANKLMMMSMAVSSSDVFAIGHIAYRREGVFFSVENALSAGKWGWECTARAKYAIYDCLV